MAFEGGYAAIRARASKMQDVESTLDSELLQSANYQVRKLSRIEEPRELEWASVSVVFWTAVESRLIPSRGLVQKLQDSVTS